MVRRIIFSFAAIVVVASLALAANDPWKSKPYQQWDEKDVRRILNESPWAKVVQVTGPSADLGGMPAEPGNGSAIPQNRSMGTAQYPQPSVEVPQQQSSQSAATPYVVRWVSSRTIREAAARSAVLKGQLKPDDAAKDLAQPIETYQVLVAGPNMKAFQALDENSLKSAAFLQTKRTKEKIAPSDVKVERSPDGASIQSVLFSFQRKSASGEPTIAPAEKGADFSVSTGRLKIDASFDFSKMDDSQGRDL